MLPEEVILVPSAIAKVYNRRMIDDPALRWASIGLLFFLGFSLGAVVFRPNRTLGYRIGSALIIVAMAIIYAANLGQVSSVTTYVLLGLGVVAIGIGGAVVPIYEVRRKHAQEHRELASRRR